MTACLHADLSVRPAGKPCAAYDIFAMAEDDIHFCAVIAILDSRHIALHSPLMPSSEAAAVLCSSYPSQYKGDHTYELNLYAPNRERFLG